MTPPKCQHPAFTTPGLTAAEFWDRVFHSDDVEFDPDEDCAYEIWVLECARCGRCVEIEDRENRERDAFCDECAEETIELDHDRDYGS